MAHPATYVNKVLVGAADGSMQLRNINSGALLYTFEMSARICCIEPSPALDVVGVGLADGAAVLHNVKFDEEVMRFENAAGAGTALHTPAERRRQQPGISGPCTCLAFRCASAFGPLLLLSVLHFSPHRARRSYTIVPDGEKKLHYFQTPETYSQNVWTLQEYPLIRTAVTCDYELSGNARQHCI